MINKNLSAQDILKGRTAQDILKGRTAKDILGNKTTTNLLDTQKQKTQTFEFEDIDYSGFDKEQSKNNLTKQLNYQLDYYKQKGYSYPHQKDLNFITDQMSYMLSEGGIKDLRQLGYKEIETPDTIADVIKKGNKYYLKGKSHLDKQKEIDPRKVQRIVDKGKGMYGMDKVTYKGSIKNAPTYMLINKETGEELKVGKFQGAMHKYSDQQGFRWGNTTRTEGMTDFMIQFDKQGNPLIYPTYKDTATDLTGIMMVANVALMGSGAALSIGNSIAGNVASQAVRQSIGQAVINGTIAEVTGGDFFKAALPAVITPIATQGLNTALGNTLFKDYPNIGLNTKRVIGATITQSVAQGINAVIQGTDVGDAMAQGAIMGGVGQGIFEVSQKIFNDNNLNFISENTNLTNNQIRGLTTIAIQRGIGNLVEGNDFFDGVTEGLVAHGLSDSITNKVVSSIKETTDETAIKFVANNTKLITNLYINSTITGQKITPEILNKQIIRVNMTTAFQGKKENITIN